MSKYIGRRMREAGQGGSIINISTVFGLDRVQQHGSVAYGSSKAGMNNMTRVMHPFFPCVLGFLMLCIMMRLYISYLHMVLYGGSCKNMPTLLP